MLRTLSFLIATSAVLAPTLASAEPDTMVARRGGVGGAALRFGEVHYGGGQTHPLCGLEAWAGYSPDGRFAYLARLAFALDTEWHDGFTELGVAARIWAPNGRVYIEPQLGLGTDEPPYDCGGPNGASDCGPGAQRGLALGLSAGVELARGPQVALDLRAGFAAFVLPDYTDAQHFTVGLAITGF